MATTGASLPYKISTLIYLRDTRGRLLLLQRRKAPNAGLWSPIGGKLEMATGESPYEAARREVLEEVGLTLGPQDLHLFCLIAERGYEGAGHWLMFCFDCRQRLERLPPAISEGSFAFFDPTDILDLPIPETDRQALWPLYFEHRQGFVALRAECHPGQPLRIIAEE